MKHLPQFYVAADSILIAGQEVLLVQRKHEPFQGKWAFPGGFVDVHEKLLDAAIRELEEETGVRGIQLVPFGTYGDPGRDPRGRVLSVVYWSRIDKKPPVKAADDAADCRWFDLRNLPEMAFDHAQVLEDVRRRM